MTAPNCSSNAASRTGRGFELGTQGVQPRLVRGDGLPGDVTCRAVLLEHRLERGQLLELLRAVVRRGVRVALTDEEILDVLDLEIGPEITAAPPVHVGGAPDELRLQLLDLGDDRDDVLDGLGELGLGGGEPGGRALELAVDVVEAGTVAVQVDRHADGLAIDRRRGRRLLGHGGTPAHRHEHGEGGRGDDGATDHAGHALYDGIGTPDPER